MDSTNNFIPEYDLNARSLDDIALEVFRYQSKHNKLYAAYISSLGIDPARVQSVGSIPFLPISFFKNHTIQTGSFVPEATFVSSGTTGSTQSRHAVRNLTFYLSHSRRCFEYFFGDLRQYHFLALLPAYLERKGSSLIAMIDHFIRESGSEHSGFYLHEHEALIDKISEIKDSGRKTILWGVSFALLDLAEKFSTDLAHCLIFETGGMKGRRREITRQELHQILATQFNCDKIYSEYGMTELLSQAYTTGDFTFHCPPYMKVLGRELTDPFNVGLIDETCALNVIDLANWNTISFIETEDLGKIRAGGGFEVLGRMDNTEVRGCNLMV